MKNNMIYDIAMIIFCLDGGVLGMDAGVEAAEQEADKEVDVEGRDRGQR
jgi:hypothetical protein